MEDELDIDYSAPLTPIPRPPARPFRWLKRLVIGLAVTAAVLGLVTLVGRYLLLVKVRNRTAEVIARLDRDDPGWRFEQIESARKVFPDSANSALPLLAAHRLLPPKWPQTRVTKSPGDQSLPRTKRFQSSDHQ